MTSKATRSPYLKKQDYIDAALEVVDAQGLDKLSVRAVADRLGVSQMALYKHFKNKDALLSATLDEFIYRADVIPSNRLGWENWTLTMAQRMYEALYRDSKWVSKLGSFTVGPTGLTVTRTFIDKLIRSGFSEQTALHAYFAMIHAVLGAVTIQTALDANQPVSTSKARATATETEAATFDKMPRQIDISLPLLISALKQELVDKN
ncbi:TetR family transcriptional regulator [Spongiibacter sp. KMU-158]|uniref:TetR family transcriptional regulator n=1 Tax=Spongiibacter pelagi TaxID=2760804 RepID=A0A927C4F7_9GAMM|nr:TetR family transcriptional regulator [Spongiibacter pelagi]MBD2859406.1 TetR family transcriptional regulator [Spongiibacter pelagi]